MDERFMQNVLGNKNCFYPTTGKNSYHSDGFLIGKNSETTKGGFTVFKNGRLIERRDITRTDRVFTNNEAELLGVLFALAVCSEGDEVATDSMNTLAWVKKGKCKARPDLSDYALKANELVHKKKVNLYWVDRERNEAGVYNDEMKYSNRKNKH